MMTRDKDGNMTDTGKMLSTFGQGISGVSSAAQGMEGLKTQHQKVSKTLGTVLKSVAPLIGMIPGVGTVADMGLGIAGSALSSFKDGVRYIDTKNIIHAANGIVTGPGGPRDDRIHAMLSNGEGVLNAGAVAHYGPSMVDDMNNLRHPIHLANGGVVSRYDRSSSSAGISNGRLHPDDIAAIGNHVGGHFRNAIANMPRPTINRNDMLDAINQAQTKRDAYVLE